MEPAPILQVGIDRIVDGVAPAARLTSDGSRTFTWSAEDHLTGRGSGTFAYAALDRLTSATVSGTTTTYAYQGDGLLSSRGSTA